MNTIPYPPPQPLDMIRAARLAGWGAVTGRDGGLSKVLRTADPSDVCRFLLGLTEGDRVLAAAVASGRWRATGDPADLAAAIEAAWAAWPVMAAPAMTLPAPARRSERTPDPRRRRLAGLALRMVREGAGALVLAAALRAEAKALGLPEADVAGAGRWAIRTAREGADATA